MRFHGSCEGLREVGLSLKPFVNWLLFFFFNLPCFFWGGGCGTNGPERRVGMSLSWFRAFTFFFPFVFLRNQEKGMRSGAVVMRTVLERIIQIGLTLNSLESQLENSHASASQVLSLKVWAITKTG